MTNREWLQSLSDEDFVKWCLKEGNIVSFNYEKDKYEYIQPYPTLNRIKYNYNSSFDGLLKWLKEERND